MKSIVYRFLILFFVFSTENIFSQNRQFQASWQQEVNYDISVSLDDVHHFLNGNIRLEYINNSPDTLTEIWIHLWPNAYKDRETPFAEQEVENGKTDFYFAKDDEHGYIDSLNFKVNGQAAETGLGQSIDVVYIKLPQPLLPERSCNITTPFRVKIPGSFSRMGHVNNSYQITQWYPKPAAYDVNGWNPIPYLDQGEFYSEFGKFRVAINVPAEYIVAHTGIEKKVQLMSEENRKIIICEQDKVHDFAWFADKNYKIISDTITLESGKKIFSRIYYINEKDANINYLTESIKYYSEKVGEYPYDVATVAIGALKAGGGMEYPTITVMPSADETTVVHEVGHNWFYGILGTNERKFPWMDEGINSYYDQSFKLKNSITKIPKKVSNIFDGEDPVSSEFQHKILFRYQQRIGNDQAANLVATDYTMLNYGAIVYGKTALAFSYLKNYLGQKIFDSMMHIYFERWKFKHPLPDDLRKIFEDVSKKNLSWFFDEMMGTAEPLDYAITSSKKAIGLEKGFRRLTIKNKGGIHAPFRVNFVKNNSETESKIINGFDSSIYIDFNTNEVKNIYIDDFRSGLDLYAKNNFLHTKGIFKHRKPIKFRMLGTLENSGVSEIYYAPLYGYNMYNGNMLGMLFYNEVFPAKKCSWLFAPMYSKNNLSGYFNVERRFNLRNESTRNIEINLYSSRFNFLANPFGNNDVYTYNKIEPGFTFYIAEQNPRSTRQRSFNAKYIYIHSENNSGKKIDDAFVDVSFDSKNTKILSPFQSKLNMQMHDNFTKFIYSFKQEWKLYKHGSNASFRFFSGYFFYDKFQYPEGINNIYSFHPAGNIGLYDYTFSQTLMGRNENPSLTNNIFTKQVSETDAFMKIPAIHYYQSDSWMFSGNIVFPFPKIPLMVFADMVYFKSTVKNAGNNSFSRINTFFISSGLKISVIKNVFEIYLPLIASKNISDDLVYKNLSFKQRISFMFNLNKLNPFRLKTYLSRAVL